MRAFDLIQMILRGLFGVGSGVRSRPNPDDWNGPLIRLKRLKLATMVVSMDHEIRARALQDSAQLG